MFFSRKIRHRHSLLSPAGSSSLRKRVGRLAVRRIVDHSSRVMFDNAPWFLSASKTKRWLVGVSGGADSVALLHGLVEAGFEDLVVCHLNHGLRGGESDEDAEFVRKLAANLNIHCEIDGADVRERMQLTGESLETAARHARHEFFAACAVKFGCARILLAHHADDQAETVLWNLLRGSHGLKGMRGEQMMTTESGVLLVLYRPLLECRKAELITWLKLQGLAWREDSSNALPIAIRNRLRCEALPLLGEISNRDVVLALARGARDRVEAEEFSDWALDRARVLDPQGRLHLPVLRELPVAIQKAAIVRYLKGAGVRDLDRGLVEKALDLCDPSKPPALNLPGSGSLRRRAGRLVFQPAASKPA